MEASLSFMDEQDKELLQFLDEELKSCEFEVSECESRLVKEIMTPSMDSGVSSPEFASAIANFDLSALEENNGECAVCKRTLPRNLVRHSYFGEEKGGKREVKVMSWV